MAFFGLTTRNGALLAAIGAAVAASGCGVGGTDVVVDAPILNAVGLNLSSKPKEEEDLPERPGLVVPPSTASLPAPGERTAAAGQNWPLDKDQLKKQKDVADAEARDKYCREGDWSKKAGICEFEKDVGREARCSSKLGDAISKSLGGGAATAR
jgi:hypothetical protein